MRISSTVKHLGFVALVCALLSACASSDPVKYTGISSTSVLKANPEDVGGRLPFLYATPVDWHRYDTVMFDPVTVYHGPDAQFGDMPETDRTILANYMQDSFTSKIGGRYRLTNHPTSNTLRIKVTLTGAATNTTVLATFTRFDIGGGIYNAVQNARDREGMLTGSVLYSVEIYDAMDSRLLKAFIAKQYPKPWNIGASMGALSAAKAGIDKGSDALLAQLR